MLAWSTRVRELCAGSGINDPDIVSLQFGSELRIQHMTKYFTSASYTRSGASIFRATGPLRDDWYSISLDAPPPASGGVDGLELLFIAIASGIDTLVM